MGKKKDEEKVPLTEYQKLLKGVKENIRKNLKEAGKYSVEMSPQIEVAASLLIEFRKVRDLINETGELFVISETSREGDKRFKINPLYDVLFESAINVQKTFRALRMNHEIRPKAGEAELTEAADDPLKKLMNNMNQEE